MVDFYLSAKPIFFENVYMRVQKQTEEGRDSWNLLVPRIYREFGTKLSVV